MLPNIMDSLRAAIQNRCNVVLIAAPGETSRQIEPYVVWKSSTEGLMLLCRQTHGHTNANKKLPAWRTIKLKKVVQFTILPTRFTPENGQKFQDVMRALKKKPAAVVDIESPYTELSEVEHGPRPVEMSDALQLYGS